jgi:hypothetical protein
MPPNYDELCEDLAAIISDYRDTEIDTPDADHVAKWASQFDHQDRPSIVSEMIHVFKKTYISKQREADFLNIVLKHSNITAGEPEAFWEKATLLEIQPKSRSQKSMNAILRKLVTDTLKVKLCRDETQTKTWIYLDDGIFTARQVISDLRKWINDVGASDTTIHIIVIGSHTYGRYEIDKFKEEIEESRDITLKFSRLISIENRKYYRRSSDILWPDRVNNAGVIADWLAHRGESLDHFVGRPGKSTGTLPLFSTHDYRVTLERAFLEKGAFICSLGDANHRLMRPLGYSGFRSVGFGTLFCTYRNCPNNAPLVLWWGDPNGNRTLRQWYPLVQRSVRPD